MNIHKPLVNTTVVVNFEVKKGEIKAISPDIEIIVPGEFEIGENEKPTVIPELREWVGRSGNFEISNSSRIVINVASEEALREIANVLAEEYKELVGNEIEVVTSDNPMAGDIYLEINNERPELRTEGHYIEIADIISIESNTATGIPRYKINTSNIKAKWNIYT